MSKTNKMEYKNKENDLRKGKIKYRERLLTDKLAEDEIEDALKHNQENVWPYPNDDTL